MQKEYVQKVTSYPGWVAEGQDYQVNVTIKVLQLD